MHELSITRSVVAIVAEQAGGRAVTRVQLEIGQLSAVMPDAIRFCFDACTQGTPLAGARLEIIEIAGRGRCQDCGEEAPMQAPFGRCTVCGSGRLAVCAGEELNIREMELATCA